jgi:hypothetical protein
MTLTGYKSGTRGWGGRRLIEQRRVESADCVGVLSLAISGKRLGITGSRRGFPVEIEQIPLSRNAYSQTFKLVATNVLRDF